jgi:energy-coupling factor transporter ATP-binding protein EcfA2
VEPVRRPHSYDEPFGWWGPMWSSPNPLTIHHLIQDGIITAECAALLGLFIERRASLIVAAGPSGAGKTTLLTTLLDFIPAGTRRIYLRGCYEPFDFLDATDPRRSVLLVNELSPHLPIYLWGPGVRRALQAVQNGYQLVGTAHATSVDEFVYSLAGYPLRVPANEVAQIDLLVLLDAWYDGERVRREVRSIVHLARGQVSSGLAPVVLASRERRGVALIIDRGAVSALPTTLSGNGDEFWRELDERALALANAVADNGPRVDELPYST